MTRRLSRRIVLRGFGGVAIGLPLLELTHGVAFAQSASYPKRFIVFFEHGGTIGNTSKNGTKHDGNGKQNGVDAWIPAANTEKLVLGAIHQPLAAHVDKMLVLRSIDNIHCKHDSPYNGDHGWANVSALTATRSKQSGDNEISGGPSIDQVVATRLAQRQPVKFPVVHLQVQAHNYGTPFFRAAGQAVSGESVPLTAFNSLLSGVKPTSSGPDPAVERARLLRKSVLDGVSTGLAQYKTALSAQDRHTVEAHLEHIRELERRLSATPTVSAGCAPPSIASSAAKNVELNGPAHVDILLAALRCGLTNVGCLNIGDFHATWLNPSFSAAYDIGHSLHHAARDVGKAGPYASQWASWYDTMLKNRQWRAGLMARLMDGLAATPEGNGTMLDNTLILWTSEFSTGAEHCVANLPIALLGGASGRLRMGRQVDYNVKAASNPTTREYQTRAGLHNLFTSILHTFGYDDANWGETYPDYMNKTTLVSDYQPGPLSGLT